MATITEPAATRPIAITTGQPIRMKASATTNWWLRTNSGSWEMIAEQVDEVVWIASSEVTRRFTFDQVHILAQETLPKAPYANGLHLDLCEGPVAILRATDEVRNEALTDPPLNPNQSEGDDLPLATPLVFPPANRDGFATLVEERAGVEVSGPANLLTSFRPGLFVDTAGKLGSRTSITPGRMSGLGPLPDVASYHTGGLYFHHDFGKSRTLGLTRVLFEDAEGHVAIVRGDGRRVTYRWGGEAFSAAAGVHNTLTSSGGTYTETAPSGRQYLYNSSGALTKVIDRYGLPCYYSYDANSRLQKIQGLPGASGMVPYLAYDGSGLLSKLVFEDPADASLNRTTYFHYTGTNLQKIIGPESCVTYFEYGGTGNALLTAVTDPEGFRWGVGYSGERVSSVEDARLNNAYFLFDTEETLARHKDRTGRVTYLDFNAFGSPVKAYNPTASADYYTYDGEGNLTSAKNRLGNSWSYEYDSRGNRISSTDPLGGRSYFAYDSTDLLREYTDAELRLTQLDYLANRNHTQTVDPASESTRFVYQSNGLLHYRQDRRDGLTYFVFDAAANLEKITDPLGHATYLAYNSAGEVTESKDALFRATTIVRDLKGRVTKQVDPIGAASYFAYDARCNLVTETDARLNTTTHVYDGNSNRTQTIDALGNPTYFGYDAEDRPSSRKNARLFETTLAYDSLGLLSSQTDPFANAQSFFYDAVHQLTKQTDELGNASYFAYDTTGRLSHSKNALLQETYLGYDLVGNQVKVVDPRGNATYMTYDDLDRLTHTENQLGHVSQSVYDVEGNVTRSIDSLGQTTYMTYDLAGRQTEVEDQLSRVTTTVYDEAGQVSKQFDQLGIGTYFTYDSAGRSQETFAPSGLATYMAYDGVGNLTHETLTQGWGSQPWGCSPWGGEAATTYLAYDMVNRQTQATDALGGVSQSIYDRVGNVTRSIDERGFATYMNYDALDRRIKAKDGVHFAQTYMGYDAAGNLVVDVDQLGFAAYMTYDRLNRAIFTHDQAGALNYMQFDAAGNQTGRTVFLGAGGEQRDTYFSYDATNRQTQVTDALGGVSRTVYQSSSNNVERTVDQEGRPTYFTYDVLNRLATRKNALGNAWSTVYDGRGSVTKQVDPVGRTSYFGYDDAGQQVTRGNALGETATTCFDARGNVTHSVNPRGNATYMAYDLLARQTHREDQLGGVRYFGYDEVGNLILQQDELGNNSYFSYDGLRRLTHANDALLAVTYFGFDARGGLVKRVSAEASAGTTYMTYDAASRLSQQSFQSPSTADTQIDFTYDPVGNVTQIADGTGKDTIQEWDKLDRLTKKVTLAGAVYYEYDQTGMKTSLKDPDLRETLYEYDSAGRLQRLEVDATRPTYYHYDASDMVVKKLVAASASVPRRVMSYYTWDAAGRLEQQRNLNNSAAEISYMAYDRNRLGAITQIRHEGNEDTYYEYDKNERLTREFRLPDTSLNHFDFSYTWDAASNRTQKIDNKESTSYEYTYDAVNLLVDETVGGVTTHFAHDDAQRMTKQWKLGEASYFAYDQRDNLVEIDFEKTPNAPDATRKFAYSGLGERVYVKDGTETYWAYDGPKLILERDTEDSRVMRYRHNDNPQLECRGSVVEKEDSAGRYYPITDWRGTVTHLADGNNEGENFYLYSWPGEPLRTVELFEVGSGLGFVSPLLTELGTTQAFSVTPSGVIYQPLLFGTSLSGWSEFLEELSEGGGILPPEDRGSPETGPFDSTVKMALGNGDGCIYRVPPVAGCKADTPVVINTTKELGDLDKRTGGRGKGLGTLCFKKIFPFVAGALAPKGQTAFAGMWKPSRISKTTEYSLGFASPLTFLELESAFAYFFYIEFPYTDTASDRCKYRLAEFSRKQRGILAPTRLPRRPMLRIREQEDVLQEHVSGSPSVLVSRASTSSFRRRPRKRTVKDLKPASPQNPSHAGLVQGPRDHLTYDRAFVFCDAPGKAYSKRGDFTGARFVAQVIASQTHSILNSSDIQQLTKSIQFTLVGVVHWTNPVKISAVLTPKRIK